MRDEEAEAQRRARSRHARQSRRSTQVPTATVASFSCEVARLLRSSKILFFFFFPRPPSVSLGLQGVTLTDVQEAEKTIKTTADSRWREKKEEEDKKEAKLKKGEEGVSERRCQPR